MWNYVPRHGAPESVFTYRQLRRTTARRHKGMSYSFARRQGVHSNYIQRAAVWCRSNFGSAHVKPDHLKRWEVCPISRRIHIRHEADAMLFKMFWT